MNGSSDMCEWLLKIQPTLNISDEAFVNACERGRMSVANMLLSKKPDINIIIDNNILLGAA